MNLSPAEALGRLRSADHGVLSTLHPDRGVDSVPAVFAVTGDLLGIPVDEVKPKASTRLRRETNLETDPRATLLVEQWDAADWSRLWWARAELSFVTDPNDADVESLSAELEKRYPQYAGRPFAKVLVFRITGMSGWSAAI